LFDTELQVASSRAAVRTLESMAECLKNKISLARCEKEALYAKYQRIQDFKKMAVSKIYSTSAVGYTLLN
jgi:methyltransferase-like protein